VTLLDTAPAPPAASPPGGPAPPASSASPASPAKRSTTRPRSPILQVVSTTVLILSAALLGFAFYVGVFSSLHHARAQHNAYANFRKALAQATAPVGPTLPVDPNKPDGPSRLLAPGTAVGVLYIPKIHLREVVFEGTTGSILQNGPGHLRGTSLPGQAGYSEIMGRSAAYGGPFGKLSHLAPGDLFNVTTGQGLNIYRVIDVRREGDPVPVPPVAGQGRLILATADGAPFIPSGVLRIDADPISPVRDTPAAVLSARDLPAAEQAMGTDPSAWSPLVLWGQALVLAAGLITWARTRWGRWQTWIVAVPVLGYFGLEVADQVVRLLPNLT
jgi:sortase A